VGHEGSDARPAQPVRQLLDPCAAVGEDQPPLAAIDPRQYGGRSLRSCMVADGLRRQLLRQSAPQPFPQRNDQGRCKSADTNPPWSVAALIAPRYADS
jgi:hypothetical protein